MSIYIDINPDRRKSGNKEQENAPIFPRDTMEFVMNRLDLFEKHDGDVSILQKRQKNS